MAASTTIVIVRPEHLASVKKRLAGAEQVGVCSESDAIVVQGAIQARPPQILVLHASFATTSRGATLVAGLKARPNEIGTAIRVFIEDEDKAPLLLSEGTLAPDHALLETSRPLDRAGTRQAARFPMNRRQVVINGEPCLLVDLSVTGAQVQVPMRLRPSQVVRFAMSDDAGDTRCQGTVAWSIAVPSGGSIQYRAGVEFIGPDKQRLETICARFGGAPDPTLGAT